MHVHVFDRYRPGHSLIHTLDPRVKVLITIGFILSNVLLPDGAWLAFLLAWGFILLVSGISELGIAYALRRSYIALPFALVAFTVLFSIPGQTLAVWHFAWWELELTDAGLLRFASILTRTWLSIQMAILLVSTTQFPDLMHALRHLKVPGVLVAIISFMYRYLFVLVDEVIRLKRAREARSAVFPGSKGGGALLWRARVTGSMVGQLFLRSFERSDRTYNAMLSRGYSGHLMTLNPHEMTSRDWVWATAALAVLFALQIIARI
jgi:cobalt/nickel transport system permease protein